MLSVPPEAVFYLYKNLNASIPGRLSPCFLCPLEAVFHKHLDFYINKKAPQGGTESMGDSLPGMEAFRFLYK